MKRQLQSFTALLFDPAISFSGFIKLVWFFATKQPIRIKPKTLLHPVRITSVLDYIIFRSIIRKGGYTFAIDENPSSIIDAGANVGYSSVFFASRYPTAQVVAIEPEFGNFQRLLENCAPYPNIICVRGALVGRPRKLRIKDPNALMHSFKVTDEEGTGAFDVEGLTVTGIMNKMGWIKVDILKADIEGSEEELFSVNQSEWINLVNLFALEVHDSKERQASRAVFRALDMLTAPYYLRPLDENLIIRRLIPVR